MMTLFLNLETNLFAGWRQVLFRLHRVTAASFHLYTDIFWLNAAFAPAQRH